MDFRREVHGTSPPACFREAHRATDVPGPDFGKAAVSLSLAAPEFGPQCLFANPGRAAAP